MTDPQQVGTILGECALPENTPTSASGLVRVNRRKGFPIRSYHDHVPRDGRLVNRQLLAEFTSCCDGVSPWPLFVHGPIGTGKTLAGLCLLDWTFWSNFHAYLTVADLCRSLICCDQGRKFNDRGYETTREQIWYSVRRCQVTVLDELGARNQTSDHHYETVKTHVDERYNKPAMYISNLPPDGLTTAYDDRVVSRLCAGTVLELAGEDRRLK